MDEPSIHVTGYISMGMCLTNEVRVMVHYCRGAIKEELLFRSQGGVIEQSVRDIAVRSRLPLALGGAVVAGTMVEVVGTVRCLLVLDCVC